MNSLARPQTLPPTSRRGFLTTGVKLAAAAGLLSPTMLTACSSQETGTQARIGIVAGTQTLWRYLASRKDELLTPLGHTVEFRNYPSEAGLRQDFLDSKVDIIATLPPQVPSLVEAGADVQYFLPIAWLREGYPIVVPSESPAQSLVDLKGKRVATFPLTHPGFAYWRAFALKNYGWRIEQYVQAVQTDQPNAALFGGQVDAVVVDGLAWGELKSTGRYRSLSDLSTEWKRAKDQARLLLFGGYIARRDWIQKNRRFIDDFIRVNADGLKTYKTDRNRVLDAAASWSGDGIVSMTRDQNQLVATYLGYDDVTPDRAYISSEDVQDYETVFRLLFESGYLSRVPDRVADRFYVSQPRS